MLQQADTIILSRGPYLLREQLAASAYGVVWRAQAPDGTAVALKLINQVQMTRADPALHARWVESANNEITFLRTLARWDERHIVRLLDTGTHDRLPVMALELMDADLARHAGSTAASFARVLDWLGQINQALAKVHQYGWLYLDLKPANVLVGRGGSVKLADFGTSRLRSALAGGRYAGTASWQAPEQFFPSAAGIYDTDTRSDYFALGAMFYYLVTGGVPLHFCSSCGDAWRLHGNAAPAWLAGQHGAVPPTLQPEEEALFMHRIAQQTSTSGAAAAMALLRSLLAAERGDRPRHALQISRMIDSARIQPAAVARALPVPRAHHAPAQARLT